MINKSSLSNNLVDFSRKSKILEKNEELDLDVYLIYANANGEFITWMNSGMKEIIEEF